MDCRYLGKEGDSELVSVAGIMPGEIISIKIPNYVLACQTSFVETFSEIIGDEAMARFKPAALPATAASFAFQNAPASTSSSTSRPQANATQVTKNAEFAPMGRFMEPSKFSMFYNDPNSVGSAFAFEPALVLMKVKEVHASFSSGLRPSLMPLTESELWSLACLSSGTIDKPFPLTKFRSPGSPEPSTTGGVLDCLRLFIAFVRLFAGVYLAGLFSGPLQDSLSVLTTENHGRFAAIHIVVIIDKVLTALKLCQSTGTAAEAAHIEICTVTETTRYVEKFLRDEQERYPGGLALAAAAGAKGGVGGGGKRPHTTPTATNPAKKVKVDQKAMAAWVALDPLQGVNICRNWAATKGSCASGKAPTCKRPHAYPTTVTPAEKQAYVAWLLTRP